MRRRLDARVLANCVTVSICNYGHTYCILVNMDTPQALPLDTQLLLALLDLKTERIIAEAEAIVISYANREAQLASAKDMRYD